MKLEKTILFQVMILALILTPLMSTLNTHATYTWQLLGEDYTGDGSPDILKVYASNDSENLYLKMELDSSTSNWLYFYIDADRNSSTGFETLIIGADYCVEERAGNAKLYKHDGEWSYVGDVEIIDDPTTSNMFSVKVPFSMFDFLDTVIYIVAASAGDLAPNGDCYVYCIEYPTPVPDEWIEVMDAVGDENPSGYPETDIVKFSVCVPDSPPYMYFKIEINTQISQGPFDELYYEVFIDADNNVSTGFNVAGLGIVGAEYLIEFSVCDNNMYLPRLYKHTGGGWNWDLISHEDYLGNPYSGNVLTMRVRMSDFTGVPLGDTIKVLAYTYGIIGGSSVSDITDPIEVGIPTIVEGIVTRAFDGGYGHDLTVKIFQGGNVYSSETNSSGGFSIRCMSGAAEIAVYCHGIALTDNMTVNLSALYNRVDLEIGYQVAIVSGSYRVSDSGNGGELIYAVLVFAPLLLLRRRRGVQTWVAIVLAIIITIAIAVPIYAWISGLTGARPSGAGGNIYFQDVSVEKYGFIINIKCEDASQTLSNIYVKVGTETKTMITSEDYVIYYDENGRHVIPLGNVKLKAGESATIIIIMDYSPGIEYTIKVTTVTGKVAQYTFIP